MFPLCPQCKKNIVQEDLNVATDVAFCRSCNRAFKLSELVHELDLDPSVDLSRPPEGAWTRPIGNDVVIGVSQRSVGGAIGLLALSLFWNGIVSVFVALALSSTLYHLSVPTPEWFPIPKMNGEAMGPGLTLFLWIFLLPFILIGILFLIGFLMSLGGRTEIRLRYGNGVIFTGIGPVGRSRRFNPQAVKSIRLEDQKWRDSEGDRRGRRQLVMELDDGKTIRFGSGLREERMKFLGAALRKVLAQANPAFKQQSRTDQK